MATTNKRKPTASKKQSKDEAQLPMEVSKEGMTVAQFLEETDMFCEFFPDNENLYVINDNLTMDTRDFGPDASTVICVGVEASKVVLYTVGTVRRMRSMMDIAELENSHFTPHGNAPGDMWLSDIRFALSSIVRQKPAYANAHVVTAWSHQRPDLPIMALGIDVDSLAHYGKNAIPVSATAYTANAVEGQDVVLASKLTADHVSAYLAKVAKAVEEQEQAEQTLADAKAEREAEKARKQAEREAERKRKQAEREAEQKRKQAERDAKKAEREAEKARKAEERKAKAEAKKTEYKPSEAELESEAKWRAKREAKAQAKAPAKKPTAKEAVTPAPKPSAKKAVIRKTTTKKTAKKTTTKKVA